MSLPTPRYNLNNYSDVYEPSEDSHLFLDALETEREWIEALKPTLACEIGSGSGILITALATILADTCAYFSTDINMSACKVTKETSLMNCVPVESVAMNLLDQFNKPFDLLLFNPPYVVTSDQETYGRGFNKAFAGGNNGRKVIDEFLFCLPKVLSARGVCYLLLLKDNKVKEVEEILQKRGFKSKVVLERKILGEYLYVYKCVR